MTRTGLEQLKVDEGCRLSPYRCTAGKLTIGYGWNLDDCPIPAEVAELMLVISVAGAENDVARIFKTRDMNRARVDVVTNMRFQLGATGIRKFKRFISATNAGDYRLAAAEMLDSRWARQTPARAKRLALVMRTGR